jgi:tetratricopeptide (TPR) repeat protein
MKGIVEFHGGTVEKFIGDAVMAVFGIPQAHEDDALRACRAASEMLAVVPELGVEARIGITTGEVVTGTEERLATGDPVNVAARLQQAAQPGEALIAGSTLDLVQTAVEVEALEPLPVKGKATPLDAYRLLTVHDEPQPRHETRFVGRARELEAIREAWERARAERRCELLTIVGEAGVGKSRLVAEGLHAVDARIVHGRCLPYGEGITYWPVVEVIKQLDARPADPDAAEAIQSLLGESEVATSPEEIAWAFRKLLEAQAPLVAVFDDIQWGEEAFLDLLEHLGLLSSGSSLLVLCMARPDLAERRSSWPVSLRLQPLAGEEVEELIGGRVSTELSERIARAAGGNPLFVNEMLEMVDETDGDVTVPPTLRALLASRLDELDPSERSVLERGAVEGEVFHRGAVRALAPGESQVTPRLAALVRKDLIRPEKSHIPGDDGFRFRHLLIRDAAYDGLPKLTRAELHERFAAWLDERGRDLVELNELVGYHLEQAARYRQELGEPDPKLAEHAGDRLAVAGRRALSRGDRIAAISLLERALDLSRPIRFDVHLEVDFAAVLGTIEPQKAAAVAEAASERARVEGTEANEALARVVAAEIRVNSDPGASIDELDELARTALPLLEKIEDHAGLVHVWYTLGFTVANCRGRMEEHAHASEQALRHARLAGQSRSDLFHLDGALAFGPRPADEAIRDLDAVLGNTRDPHGLLARAYLLAMLGRFDEARKIVGEQTDRLRELRGTGHDAWAAWIARLEGDEERAAAHFRTFCDALEEQGQTAALASFAPDLGRSLCALGRHEEAERLAQFGRQIGNEQDVLTQALWRQTQALVLSSRGDHAEAERLAREALAILEPTDTLMPQGEAFEDLAEVLHEAGRADEAAAALEQAVDRYERKRSLVMADRVRSRLLELRTAGADRP